MPAVRRASAFSICTNSMLIATLLLLSACGKGKEGSEPKKRASIASEDSLNALSQMCRYDLARKVLALQPENVTARWLYLRGYFLREMATFFGDLYDFSLELNRRFQKLRAREGIDSPVLPFVQGMLAFEAEAYHEADRCFRQVQGVDETLQVWTDILHGASLSALEDRKGAEKLWERSREKWRNDPVAQALAWDVWSAMETERKGMDIEVSDIIQQLQGIEPGRASWARVHLAAGVLVRGDPEAVLDILEPYDPIAPLFTEPFRGRYSGNEYERAFFSTLFLKVYSDTYYILADRDLTAALDKGLEPNDALSAQYFRGLVYGEQGRYPEAYRDLMSFYKGTVQLAENPYLTYVRSSAGIRAGEYLYRIGSDRGEEAQELWREVFRFEKMDAAADVGTVRQSSVAGIYFEIEHRRTGMDLSESLEQLFRYLSPIHYTDLADEELEYYHEACMALSRIYVERSGPEHDPGPGRAISLLNGCPNWAGFTALETHYSPQVNAPALLLLLSRAYYADGLNSGLGTEILACLNDAYSEVSPVLNLYQSVEALKIGDHVVVN